LPETNNVQVVNYYELIVKLWKTVTTRVDFSNDSKIVLVFE